MAAAPHHEGLAWPEDDPRVLVPFHEAINQMETSLLGASVASGSDGELYLLHAIGGGGTPNSDTLRDEAALRMRVREEFDVPVVQSEESYSSGVLQSLVESYGITTTIVDREQDGFFARGSDRPSATDCHHVVGTRMDRFQSPSSVLVPVARGPHSGLATRVAAAVARAYDCRLELFHVVPEDASEDAVADADGLLDAYEYRLRDDVEVDHHVTRAPDAASGITEHSRYHDLTVVGAPEKGRLRRFLFGSTADEVTGDEASGPVLMAHRDTEEPVLSRWL
ncbi:universal stress protein [Halobacterium yunchengense]|uniref:universal stress protein n=1 Tax=Halobacterium yunchengense TaxID=3108497 RepID=UPI00300BCA53